MSLKKTAVVFRRCTGIFTEQLAEIVGVIAQTNFLSNLIAVKRAICAHQRFGMLHAYAQQIAAELLPHGTGKFTADVVRVHIHDFVRQIL